MSAQRKITETVSIVAESGPATTLGAEAEASVAKALAAIEEVQRPIVLRATLRRRKMEQELSDVEGLIEEQRGQEALLHSAFEAANQTLAAYRDDLEAERAMLVRALDRENG